jgi:hypothetical protein
VYGASVNKTLATGDSVLTSYWLTGHGVHTTYIFFATDKMHIEKRLAHRKLPFHLFLLPRQSAHRWRWGCQLYASSYPCNRSWRPIGFWDVEAPIFSRQSAHRWRWGCQLYAPSYPCNRPWRLTGFWDVEAPIFSTQLAHRWRWGCQLYTSSYPCNRPWRPIGFWDVEAPIFSRQSAHRRRWGCQPYAPAALYPQEDSWYSLLLETESTPGP